MKEKILNLINTKKTENIIFAAYLAKANNIMPEFWSIIIRDRKKVTYTEYSRLANKISWCFNIGFHISSGVLEKAGIELIFDNSGFELATSWINFRINNFKSYMIINMYNGEEHTISHEYIDYLKTRWT